MCLLAHFLTFCFLFLFFPIFCRKSIKLYSDFYSSDVIVASPVRLIAVSIYSFDFFSDFYNYYREDFFFFLISNLEVY